MNKAVVVSILGMAITGAIAVLMIPTLFETPIPRFSGPTLAGSAATFAIFTISAFVLRKRLKGNGSGNPDS